MVVVAVLSSCSVYPFAFEHGPSFVSSVQPTCHCRLVLCFLKKRKVLKTNISLPNFQKDRHVLCILPEVQKLKLSLNQDVAYTLLLFFVIKITSQESSESHNSSYSYLVTCIVVYGQCLSSIKWTLSSLLDLLEEAIGATNGVGYFDIPDCAMSTTRLNLHNRPTALPL